MDGGPCEEGKAFVVVPRFILDEMFGLIAVFLFSFFFCFFWWCVCGWWGCVWVARRVGYIHVLSNSLVVM